jgi:hypothetical protein
VHIIYIIVKIHKLQTTYNLDSALSMTITIHGNYSKITLVTILIQNDDLTTLYNPTNILPLYVQSIYLNEVIADRLVQQ